MAVGAARYRAMDMRASFGTGFERLPWAMRILLENGLRCSDAPDDLLDAFRTWLRTGASAYEMPFRPSRVMMHDTTCVPALVDIAAMRDAVAESGGDPSRLSPVIPVDVSIDHSVGVDRFGTADALAFNMKREFERNQERYRLMKWATLALPGVRIHPPGTGIMHTINMEHLASVIAVASQGGQNWLHPDTLVGTDSHTPMVNALGVLGWGVGGLEAESAMFGLPIMMRLPDVIGVKLVGRLKGLALATDLALAVTERLRRHGVAGCFVEFFGPGVTTLSVGERGVIANMAPEYGATTGYFPVDNGTVRYLEQTGRASALIARVKAASRALDLWFDPDITPRYSEVIELDMNEIGAALSGPRRPQDRVSTAAVQSALEAAEGRSLRRSDPAATIPDGAIAIAAITSCTNTTDPALLVAAGLMARKARARGLAPPPWVKTSLAPGSPAAERYLARTGLLADLETIGFGIVGFGCTTCIGNSGPLTPEMEASIAAGNSATAVLSGNRNFPGRVHPSLRNGFLASPPLVLAYALAGDAMRNIETDPINDDRTGAPVFLRDIWPSRDEVDRFVKLRPADFIDAFDIAQRNTDWAALEAPSGVLFPWDERSTYIRRPPFAAAKLEPRIGRYRARPLLSLGDDMTTDHISPAGQISASSHAGRYLVANGDPADDLNVFAARRGNWEVMVRGLYWNRDAVNLLDAEIPIGQAKHIPSGRLGPIWETALRYQDEGVPTVIVAGERYGAGSSRDWAAKGVSLLGVRAVLAQSFERIHRTNLIGMGVLPIQTDMAIQARVGPLDLFEIDAEELAPSKPIAVRMVRPDGTTSPLTCTMAIETELECRMLTAGGMIPLIISELNG
ncbi:aconitate hydratase AcnA [Mesorhizobium sp.]|uniref:aconitate hydratase AcnA n=1 Tax=Mesorhizobium sp. TaxID=1871066 RepID=UPI0025C0F2CD|nr:aconitate hydratase AcnA [Mesorhizobium sp.]